MARDSRQAALTSTSSKRSVAALELEYVHGYRGYDCRNNLYYLPDGRLVYHAASLGILLDTKANTQVSGRCTARPRPLPQRFFTEHTDDIISLAINRGAAFEHIVATGQIGKSPVIYVWDALKLQARAAGQRWRLTPADRVHDQGLAQEGRLRAGLQHQGRPAPVRQRRQSGNVSPDCCVAPRHTCARSIAVHKWKSGVGLAITTAKSRIFVAKFKPGSDTQARQPCSQSCVQHAQFVTCGIKHIKFWTLAGAQLLSKRGVVGRGVKMQTMLSVGFGTGAITYSGAMSGDIYVWNDFQVAVTSRLRGISHSHGSWPASSTQRRARTPDPSLQCLLTLSTPPRPPLSRPPRHDRQCRQHVPPMPAGRRAQGVDARHVAP